LREKTESGIFPSLSHAEPPLNNARHIACSVYLYYVYECEGAVPWHGSHSEMEHANQSQRKSQKKVSLFFLFLPLNKECQEGACGDITKFALG